MQACSGSRLEAAIPYTPHPEANAAYSKTPTLCGLAKVFGIEGPKVSIISLLCTMLFSSLWLLCLCAPLSTAATFPSCGDANSTTTIDSSPNASDVPVEVNILGQSGKITIVPKGSSGNYVGIRVTMDALREVDAGGEAVGKTGSVKNSVHTVAAQDFTVGSVEQVTTQTPGRIQKVDPLMGVPIKYP